MKERAIIVWSLCTTCGSYLMQLQQIYIYLPWSKERRKEEEEEGVCTEDEREYMIPCSIAYQGNSCMVTQNDHI
jgi:hypothetical protein